MFMLRAADKATGGVAAMPQNPRRQCAERAEERLRFHHREHSLRQQWRMPHACASECGNGIAEGWSDQWRRHLSHACRVIVSSDDLDMNLWNVAIAHNRVVVEV
jgi:hypothetical protein